MSINSIIEIRGLTFNRADKVIFNNVDINIPKGKITALMGPSGTGKTTLLHAIGGKIIPEKGKIIVNNKDVLTMSNKEIYRFRKSLGMMFQNSALFTDITVLDNVAFPIIEHTKLPIDVIKDICLMKLEAVGLRGASKLYPEELSGGMARRVALARATALDPNIMMLDEPFTGQDPISMGILVKLIKMLNDTLNMTTIVVSHNIPETLEIADYIYILEGGKIVGEGTPEEILNSDNPCVKQFIKGLPDGPIPFQYPGVEFSKELAL